MPRVPSLLQRIRPTLETIIVDAGANPMDPTGHYRPLLGEIPSRLFGFEPQAETTARLNALHKHQEIYLPYLLGDGRLHTLRICRASVMTSLLEPDPVACGLFHRFDQLTEVVERKNVWTRALDDIEEIPRIDHLKMNVCGSEKMILAHGRNKLSDVSVVQLEVSFIPLYQAQPTIGELDLQLRSMGLIPHAMPMIKTWGVKPLIINNSPGWPVRQLLVAEMVYVADYRKVGQLPTELLKQMALILHYCYQSMDVVLLCLNELASRKEVDNNPGKWYVDHLEDCLTPAA